MLALVLAKVENFEGTVVFASRFTFTLDADQPLAGSMDGELAEIGGDPFAAELFGDGGCRTGAGKEVGDQIAFVATGFNDALN